MSGALAACSRALPEWTPFFCRDMALRCLRQSRLFEWVPGSRNTWVSLAKSYLASYKVSRAEWMQALTGGSAR